MPKKLTYEFVKDQFEKEGYELLSRVYVNNRTKLKYKCPKDHEHQISWSEWYSLGSRCPYCANRPPINIDFVKSEFAKEGYKLLTKNYANAHTKLDYICPKEHKHNITWNRWQQGQRCPYCDGQGKPTIEFIRNSFENEGYELLSEEYVNSRIKLEYRCPKGHDHFIVWGAWVRGQRCPVCAGQGKPTIEFIRSEFEKEGCKLLSKKYVNSYTKLDYICSNGHKHSIVWPSWRHGNRCSICDSIKKSGSGNCNWKGGISCEPYCDVWLDKEFKESIKERDNYQCQNPDCWQTSEKLTIHHIDYNKKNCQPENLITLCNSCNGRANFDRSWHKSFYRIVMRKKNKIKKFVMGL